MYMYINGGHGYQTTARHNSSDAHVHCKYKCKYPSVKNKRDALMEAIIDKQKEALTDNVRIQRAIYHFICSNADHQGCQCSKRGRNKS